MRVAFNKIADYDDIDDDKGHPFKNQDIRNEGEDAHGRQDFSISDLHQIREKEKGDEAELALIIGIAMDTGVRVSERVGLW